MNIQELLNQIRPYVVGWINKSGTWIPTFTGFSVDPTVTCARYVLVGKLCTVFVHLGNGTSNATTFTISAPFQASNPTGTVYWMNAVAYATDVGVVVAGGCYAYMTNNDTSITLIKGATNWTNTGNKRAVFTLIYEVV